MKQVLHPVIMTQKRLSIVQLKYQKKNKMNIDEGKQYGVEGSKQINETQIYQSKDLLDSLDLMHRLCK